MVKFTTSIIVVMAIIVAGHGITFGQIMDDHVDKTKAGYRTVHLVNLKSVEFEDDVVAIAEDFNAVVTELGYQGIRFSFWKETGSHEGQFKYIFESTWPDKETYDKVHEFEEFMIVWRRSIAKWKEMIEVDVYNRYYPMN